MSVDKQNTLSKIRTFAQDLKEIQPATDQPAEGIATKPVKGGDFETPKMAAPNTSRHHVTVERKIPAVSAQEIPKADPKEGPDQKAPIITPSPVEKTILPGLQHKVEEHIKSEPRTPAAKVKVRSTPKKGRRLTTTTTSIITDVKPGSDSFFARLKKSFNSWLQTTKKNKQRTKSQYVIEDTVRRKGVIQKATTRTGALFTADNETLREEIRKRRSFEKTHEEARGPEVTWSPNTESGFALLQSPEIKDSRIKNVQVDFKKKTVPAPVVVEPTDTRWEQAAVIEVVPETREYAPVVIPAPEPITEIPEIIEPVTITAPESPVVFETTLPQEAPLPTKTIEIAEIESLPPELPVTEVPLPKRVPKQKSFSLKDILQRKVSFYDINTNTISITAAAGIIILIAFILLVRSVFTLVSSETSLPTSIETTPILGSATVVDTTLSEYSSRALLQAVAESDAAANSSLTEINFVSATNEDVPSQDVIELLGFSTNTNLNRSITEIRLLSIEQVDRAIIFTTTDDTTAFGALLAWEENMAVELAPIIDLPLTSLTARFLDKTLAGSDVRVLSDGGSEILVYGFIDKGIVLIAPDSATFTLIANKR